MSRKIPFLKMVASGNDFVVVDNRRRVISDGRSFARRICPQHIGIGADGVLLFENSKKADFKMRIINADGSEAEACGNGFRCIAKFAREKLKLPKRFKFDSLSGIVGAEVSGKRIRVQLPNPKGLQARGELQVAGNRLHYSFINTGVPHVVVLVKNLKKMDVTGLGREIRYHKKFKPKGTNVNFVAIENKNRIGVRTYERGVEGETLACGTGSTASAIVSSVLDFTKSPISVKTRSGEVLRVRFNLLPRSISDVYLEGEARIVYEGTYHLN